jgi:hypothetical protein
MFVHYFTHVPVPIAVVESRIDDVRSDLEQWAGIAYREAEELRAVVGPRPERFAKKVRLVIGEPEVRGGGVVYAVRWTAVGAEALFPRLTADLTLSHVGPERTKLTLEGTYDPPLGPVGRAADRVMLRRVAEVTVQDWVDRVASAVLAPTG